MRLGYQPWRTSIRTPLVELFAAFATVNELDPTVPTVSKGVGSMCSGKLPVLDATKVAVTKDNALKAAQAAAGAAKATARYAELLTRLLGLGDGLRAVSGKDFLLPLIGFHLQSFGCRIKKRSLRVRLAGAVDRTQFAELAEALRLAARGYV